MDLTKPEPDPAHRRRTDLPMSVDQVILQQLGELRTDVREGFARIEAKYDGLATRVQSLESFREREEEAARQAARAAANITGRWIPVAIAIMAVLSTVVLFFLGGGAP